MDQFWRLKAFDLLPFTDENFHNSLSTLDSIIAGPVPITYRLINIGGLAAIFRFQMFLVVLDRYFGRHCAT
jgi:hypothetical protein